jgi:F-type H+-transporting ATPase subunit b
MVLAPAAFPPYRSAETMLLLATVALEKALAFEKALVAAAQAISVDVDATFLVALVLFVGLTLILKPVLFDPMLKLFEEREKRIDGAKAQARKIDEKSVTALTKYEGEMALARAAGGLERDRIRAEGLKREQEILAAVRATAAKTLEDGKRAAQTEADRARTALKGDTTSMARDLASRVLGREVQP